MVARSGAVTATQSPASNPAQVPAKVQRRWKVVRSGAGSASIYRTPNQGISGASGRDHGFVGQPPEYRAATKRVTPPTIYLLCGLPRTGKTTRCRT